MNRFINRGAELQLIREALTSLLNKDHFARTPIIDFYGVEGIGKTSIIEKIQQECGNYKIRCIKTRADKDFLGDIISQAKQDKKLPPLPLENKDLLNQSIEITRALLGQESLVMLLDAVDTTNEEQVEQVETLLGDIITYGKLFVVLTSRKSIAFVKRRSVAHRLTTIQLSLLDRGSCKDYLEHLEPPIEPAVREVIFSWTRGYPLAMNVMVEAIEEGLNPRKIDDQKAILASLFEKVITGAVLVRVKKDDIPWFLTVLSLLSVPRRCNLLIMQYLIERFESDLKMNNSLAYIVLPNSISQGTDVLHWDLAKAGFTVDAPVRNIFLLQLKIENPERYYRINKFLAEINWKSADEATGLDRVRYQQEYLYHSANSEDARYLPQILVTTVQQIIQEAENTPDDLVQFQEEFMQDDELKELLGNDVSVVLSMISQKLAQKMHEEALREKDRTKRLRYLIGFFYYTAQDPDAKDLSGTLKEQLKHLIDTEDPVFVLQLYEELAHDDQFKRMLGEDFSPLFDLIRKNVSPEG